MVYLTYADNYLEAHTLKALLEEQSIAVFLKGEALAGALGELPINEAQIEVYVHQKDLTRAQHLLEYFRQATTENEPDWVCSGCGESNGVKFEFCWQCQQEHNP